VVIVLSALSVVAAAVLLGAWFLVGGGFALIYAAMALAAASMALLWAARWIGSTPDAATADRPTPVPDTEPAADAARGLVGVSAGRPEPAPVAAAGGADAAPGTIGPDPATGPTFPIADYDTLWVSQILPLLDDLDDAELTMVDARERGGRHRVAVLEAVAARRPAADDRAGPGARPEPGAWEQGPAAGPVAPLCDLDLDLGLDERRPRADHGSTDDEVVEGRAEDPVAEPDRPVEPVAETGPLGPEDPFALLDPADQTEEDRLWAAAVPILDQGRDPFLDDEGSGPAATFDVVAEADVDVDVRTDGVDLVLVDAAPVGDGGPLVRTFLGHRRSPVTIRRG
jgi:hypothetical protein